MIEEFWLYIDSLINDVPLHIYVLLFCLFIVGTFVIIIKKGSCALSTSSLLLCVEYTFLIYCSTVIFREEKLSRTYNYIPFWSYERPDLLVENVMNVVVFIPVGFLLGCTFKNINWRRIVLIGGCLSLSIELFQLIIKRGLSELDDVMHNSIGCLIGYAFYSLINYEYEKHYKS